LATNRLNDLSNTEWVRFTKSWEIINPSQRSKDKRAHPAAYPEELVLPYISFFTKQGGWVLEPFLGSGSTLIAAMKLGRNAAGIELNPHFAGIARDRIRDARKRLDVSERVALATGPQVDQHVLCGDSRFAVDILGKSLPGQQFDYCITSPPYWDMLHQKGAENQQKRRDEGLQTVYSDSTDDMGNIHDYDQFVTELVQMFARLAPLFKPKAYLTVVLQNVRKGPKVYPLAWDFAIQLDKTGAFDLSNEKLWCLPPGEKVWTTRGSLPIEDVNEGDEVLSHDGALHRVTSTMSRPCEGPVVSLKPKLLNRAVRLTPEHEVLAMPRATYFHANGKRFFEPFANAYRRGPRWVPAGELKDGDLVAFPVPTDERDAGPIDVLAHMMEPERWAIDGDRLRLDRVGGRVSTLPRTIELTDEFMELAGWYIAEGSSGVSGVCIANHAEDVNVRVACLVRKVFGLPVNTTRRGVWCYSRMAGQLLSSLFGADSYTKRIPAAWLHLPVDRQKHLLRGMWGGDGHSRHDMVGYTTASEELALATMYVSARCGAVPSIRVESGKYHHLQFRATDAHNMRSQLALPEEQEGEFRRSQHWFRDGLVWIPLSRVSLETYSGPVYNLSVQEANSYTTSAFVVHNCQDNKSLFPFAVGSAFVANQHHHYCLNFRRPVPNTAEVTDE